jgi:hypothetical protein
MTIYIQEEKVSMLSLFRAKLKKSMIFILQAGTVGTMGYT